MAELTTLARPYARAAFEVAVETGKLGEWADGLSLVAAVVNERAVKTALSSPSLTGARQAQLVTDLCGEQLGLAVQNFVAILAENKRISLMPEIVSLFETMKAAQEKKVDVRVISAFPLADSVQAKFAASLKTRLQREVILHSEVDKSLIGGAIIRAGDLVIDGSVRGKLAKLAESMKA